MFNLNTNIKQMSNEEAMRLLSVSSIMSEYAEEMKKGSKGSSYECVF